MVQPTASNRNALHDLGYKIFLDRYAQKDMARETLAVGDIVIVVVNPQTGQREIGTVEKMNLPTVTVKLNDGEVVERDLEHVDKPLEVDPAQMMDRVARGIAEIEKTPELREQWAEEFRWLLEDWKFVPGGRILTAAGTDQELTFYNCMPPEQEILTEDGYKPIADVHVGDYVVTHRNRLRKVLHKFERETEEELYIIKPKKVGYDDLRVTGEHKVYIIRSEWVNSHRDRDGLRLKEEPQWIPAKELKPGDYVAVAYDGDIRAKEIIRLSDYIGESALGVEEIEYAETAILTPHSAYEVDGDHLIKATAHADGTIITGKRPLPLNNELIIDEDLCYLFGRWLGDGCVVHRTGTDIPSGIKIVFSLEELADAEEIAEIFEAKFGISADIKFSSTKRWYDLWVNSMPVGEFFKAFLGYYSHSKRIPQALMRLSNRQTKSLLRGLFKADGYISGSYIGILLSNRELTAQMHQLLLRLGYFFSIKENTHKNGRTPAYRLTATGSEADDLFEYFFDTTSPERSRNLSAYIEYDNLRWVRINEIGIEDYSGLVLDVEVEEDHSFVSAGVVVSNCYVLPSPHDSREGIMTTLTQMTEIMSRGGGVGMNISTLRPRHSYVKGVNGRSSGSVSWGALYSFVTGLIEQGGSRRGALMLILNDWHPDVFDFINSKRQMGQITNANISVGVSDTLMEAVKNDSDWDLVFPDTSDPDYDTLWDGDLDTWAAAGRKVLHYKTIKARELWDAIIESAWASAEPGVWFRERSNKMANSWYFNPLISTNPCHSGNNLIHTRQGLIPIKELAGKEFEVVSDLRTIGGAGVHYERAVAYPTGKKQLYEIKLKTGQTIELTENHKVFTTRGKVAVADLKIDEDEILIQSSAHLDALIELDDALINEGRFVGWNAGDGWVSQFPEKHQGSGVNVGFIFNKKEEAARDFILEYINGHSSSHREVSPRFNKGCWEVQTSNTNTVALLEGYGITPTSRKRVTTEIAQAPVAFRVGFLQGLFSADGSVRPFRNSKTGDIILVTVNKLLAKGVQYLLADLGIKTYLRSRSAKGMQYVTMDGDIRTSKARVAYTVRVGGAEGVQRFARLVGFSMSEEKQATLDNLLEEMQDIRKSTTYYYSPVVDVKPTKVKPVYNLTTDISHSLVANGMVVGNCGEQPLGKWSVCNLGAINLSRFANRNLNDVDWDALDKAIRVATRFLDNVIDTTPYFFQQNADMQLSERRVGLGTMGIAELMVKLGIRYGSEESVDFIEKVYKTIACASYETSADLAKEKGAFPQFEAEKFLESGFMQQMPDNVREKVSQQGIRNVTLLTQAPTGTTGTMVNTSTGIEPFFSWVYYRKSRLGLHEEQVPVVAKYYEENPDATELPDYFVTAMDLTPREHVKVQGAFQKWIDSAISKTSNVPNHYTIEQVSDLYMYMYDIGCKGGTIYRDGSRDEQVLMLKGDERAESEMDEVKGTKKEEKQEPVTTPHREYPRPNVLNGTTVRFTTPFGKSYITMNSDEHSNPFEVFITVGKAGSDIQADAEALGRMISLQLRTTAPHNRRNMLKLVIEQLQDIGGARPSGFGPKRVLSLPDAVGRALLNHYFNEDEPLQQLGLPMNGGSVTPPKVETPAEDPAENGIVESSGFVSGADMCPECGTISLIRAEGCRKCLTCGYSEC